MFCHKCIGHVLFSCSSSDSHPCCLARFPERVSPTAVTPFACTRQLWWRRVLGTGRTAVWACRTAWCALEAGRCSRKVSPTSGRLQDIITIQLWNIIIPTIIRYKSYPSKCRAAIIIRRLFRSRRNFRNYLNQPN